jgi:transcriptional/translational regulatory protein YebC/TACO1
MSGHSKWSTIKRQKGVNDSKRSAMFTKVAREIAVTARAGGGDPDANYRLRLAIDKARSINMPAENIKRSIEKATGGGDEVQYEEIVYEGYGSGGVAVEDAESAMIAKQTVTLDADHVRKTLRLVDLLEDLDDVQRVTTNVDIPEELLAEMAG